jgi:hypothetical protein
MYDVFPFVVAQLRVKDALDDQKLFNVIKNN